MNRLGRMAACCGAAAGVFGIARAWGQTHAAPSPPMVEIVLPADVDKHVRLISEQIIFDGRTQVMQTEGNVTIELPDGVRLNIRQATVQIPRAGANGEQRLLVNPLPAAPTGK